MNRSENSDCMLYSVAELADLSDVAMGLFFAGAKKSTDGSANYGLGHISRIFMRVGVEITGKQIGFLSIECLIEYFVSSRFLPFIVTW
jgi:hypothetical protein